MKPRQLANVLIKVLGLSMCAHGIAPAIQLLWQMSASSVWGGMSGIRSSVMAGSLQGFFLVAVAPLGIGALLILFSPTISAMLVRDEE